MNTVRLLIDSLDANLKNLKQEYKDWLLEKEDYNRDAIKDYAMRIINDANKLVMQIDLAEYEKLP